jgi:predicted phage terminase large subunit-like protein
MPTTTGTTRDRMASRHQAVGSPVLFAHHVSGGRYLIRPHLVAIDRAVRRAIARGGRLVIEMPPRHGKSETVSRYLPPWYLGTFPDRRVILASYEASFAASWGRKARDLMEEHGGLWGLGVRPDARAASEWYLTGHEGGMVTAGVGGSITGKGGHLIVVDDPVKNAKEAMSPTFREAAWEWYQSTLRTRLEPGGCIILMATRWHKDDLLGRVLRESEEEWEELRLPAIAEPGDPLGRGTVTCPMCMGTGQATDTNDPEARCMGCNGSGEVGSALWEERYPVRDLLSRRIEAPYWFAAMYQGLPRPLEGGLFHKGQRRYYTRMENGDVVLQDGTFIHARQLQVFATMDVAASERTSADYTVVSTWGWDRLRGNLLLLDVVRLRQATPKHRDLVRASYARWRHTRIGIENQTYGLQLLQELRSSGLPLEPLPADRDKVTRALQAAALYENGQVFHPERASWLEEWETELEDFPNGDHDDQVDTAGYAAQMVAEFQYHNAGADEGDPLDVPDDDHVSPGMHL